MLYRPLQGNQLYVRAVSFDGSLRRMNTHFKTVFPSMWMDKLRSSPNAGIIVDVSCLYKSGNHRTDAIVGQPPLGDVVANALWFTWGTSLLSKCPCVSAFIIYIKKRVCSIAIDCVYM